jgi:hypothetical protein
VNVQLIRIDRFPKSPIFDTFWPREHGERSKKKGKVNIPHRNTLRYIYEFFQRGQAIVAEGRTKTRFLVARGFPVTDSIPKRADQYIPVCTYTVYVILGSDRKVMIGCQPSTNSLIRDSSASVIRIFVHREISWGLNVEISRHTDLQPELPGHRYPKGKERGYKPHRVEMAPPSRELKS